MKNPLGTIHNATGRPLPVDFIEKSKNYGGNYDRRDLENLWRTPQWSAKPPADPNVVRDARLGQ